MSYKKSDRITAQETEQSADLSCRAHWCPNLWSVDCPDRGINRLCSAHAWVDAHLWPSITDRLQREVVERARRATEATPIPRAWTQGEKVSILRELQDTMRQMRERRV